MRVPFEMTVPPEAEAARLDAVLAIAVPGSGLRTRRRLWDSCRVLVNGVARKPGWLVSAGDAIRVEALNGEPLSLFSPPHAEGDGRMEIGEFREGAVPPLAESMPPFGIAAANACCVAFDKPAGLHTVQISGSGQPSLEGLLPHYWKALWRKHNGEESLPEGSIPPLPLLVTRLDKETSGIVLGILENVAGGISADSFREWERQGKVRKQYFCMVRGEAPFPLEMRRDLDTRNRAVTKILDEDSRDPTRHTLAEPLAVLRGFELLERGILSRENSAAPDAGSDGVFTLLRVTILRGARHQIRAHLACAGFPVLGDPLYGESEDGPMAARMYLHHASLALPGFSALSMPGWGLGERL